jgi:hypothetical protein
VATSLDFGQFGEIDPAEGFSVAPDQYIEMHIKVNMIKWLRNPKPTRGDPST